MKKSIAVFGIVMILLAARPGDAAVPGPYTADAYTLHLYHFDGNAYDAAASNTVNLTLRYGATVSEPSYPNFGTALNTYEGSSDTSSNMPIAYNSEESISKFTGANGAFTFEAIIRPAVAIDSIPNNMQIISGDDDSGDVRGWQFRVTTAGQLEFIKLTGTQENFQADIPTAGDQAWAAGQWFHVAVTYTGLEGTAGNLKFYWTALDAGEGEAALLGSFQMEADLDASAAIDFAIGNEGRDISGENFEGMVDEARISSIARMADDMLFVPGSPRAEILTQPSDATVHESQTASFATVFESQSDPTAAWFKSDPAGDLEMNPADPDITTQVTYDSGSDQYTATLWIADTAVSDSGGYYCRIDNESEVPRDSDTADLLVQGLAAHWTLDQGDFVGGVLLDCAGSHDAVPSGTPVFGDGADGSADGALQITPDSGWANADAFDPSLGSGAVSISLWVNWQEGSAVQDVQVEARPEGDSVAAADGLRADDHWQHICAVFDGTSAKIYLDGVLAAEGPWPLPPDTSALLTIGSAANGEESFNGLLDDLRIYNYALSETEAADLFSAVSGERVCILAYAASYDFTGPEGQPDCRVDLYDLAAFANQWLTLYGIDDLADLARNWQSSGLYPAGD